MTRAQAVANALAAVVKARQAHKMSLLCGDLPWVSRQREGELFAAIDTLDALPPEDTAGTVEVRAVVLMSQDGLGWTVCGSDVHRNDDISVQFARNRLDANPDEIHTASIVARVRLFDVPVIQASVEDAG